MSLERAQGAAHALPHDTTDTVLIQLGLTDVLLVHCGSVHGHSRDDVDGVWGNEVPSERVARWGGRGLGVATWSGLVICIFAENDDTWRIDHGVVVEAAAIFVPEGAVFLVEALGSRGG